MSIYKFGGGGYKALARFSYLQGQKESKITKNILQSMVYTDFWANSYPSM